MRVASSFALCFLLFSTASCGKDDAQPAAASDTSADDVATGTDASDAPIPPEDTAPKDSMSPEDSATPVVPPPAPIPELDAPTITSPAGEAGGLSIQPGVAVSSSGEIATVFTHAPSSEEALRIAITVDGSPIASLNGSAEGARNEPTICALSSGGFAAAWSFDGQSAGGTLGIEAGVIDITGSPLTSFPVTTAVEGNHWLGHVACRPDGGFVVAGVRTDTDDTTFGVFAQLYTAEGEPEGDALTGNPLPDGTQVHPTIAAGPNAQWLVAWEDSIGDSASLILGRAFGPDGALGDPQPWLSGNSGDAVGASLSIEPVSGAVVLGATIDNGHIRVVRANGVEGPALDLPLPASTGIRHSIAVTHLERADLFAAVYTAGSNPSAQVQVSLLGPAQSAPEASTLSTGSIPPYPPAIAWGAGQLVVAWTERVGEAYEIRQAVFAPGEAE